MQNYKISVSKENKRYTIFFKAENEAIARERVHNEGYSILGVEEVGFNEELGNIFIFEAYKNGELKHGKIVGDDIFKCFVKLQRNLEYEVVYLYSEKDSEKSEEYKKKIIEELQEEYDLIYKNRKKDKLDELREKIKKEKEESIDTNQFHMKKELDETKKLIFHVLTKLDLILSGKTNMVLSEEQKDKLENIYNSIIKLKKSTNISKLKEIGELALQKIGKLELSQLEDTKDEKSRELLKETNKLLKELGSKDRFIEKDRDISYQTKKFFSSMKEYFKNKKQEKQQFEQIDKESHSYVKTQLYLNKYEEKLRENTILIFKNFFKILTKDEYREMLFLKRVVIKQNIFLLKSKLRGKVVSYSSISKGVFGFFGIFGYLLDSIRKSLFSVIFIFSLMFLLFLNLNFEFNYFGIFIFLFLILLYFFLSLSKKIYFLLINFALFSFIIILGVINF